MIDETACSNRNIDTSPSLIFFSTFQVLGQARLVDIRRCPLRCAEKCCDHAKSFSSSIHLVTYT